MPSRADYDKLERGYYEQILDANRVPGAVSNAVAGALAGHAETFEVEHGRLTDPVPDLREGYVLKPSMTHDPGRRIPWSTNRRGMRDREYSQAKPPGTFRIALVGDSIAAGWGVGDTEVFEARIEAALNSAGGPAVEVLNFAVPGHGPGQRWTHFEKVGWAFAPDAVVFEATPADLGWDERRLRVLLPRGVGFDAPVYRDALAAAQATPGLDAARYKARLKPHRRALLENVYRVAAAECRARSVASVWVLIPRVGKPVDPTERREMAALARAAGFDTVVDACDVYDGVDPRDLAVAPHDFHPNADGHARLARALEPSWRAAFKLDRAAPATTTTALSLISHGADSR